MVLSLQGCMAVGKTTAVTYLKENVPYVNISYEMNSDIIQQLWRCSYGTVTSRMYGCG